MVVFIWKKSVNVITHLYIVITVRIQEIKMEWLLLRNSNGCTIKCCQKPQWSQHWCPDWCTVRRRREQTITGEELRDKAVVLMRPQGWVCVSSLRDATDRALQLISSPLSTLWWPRDTNCFILPLFFNQSSRRVLAVEAQTPRTGGGIRKQVTQRVLLHTRPGEIPKKRRLLFPP